MGPNPIRLVPYKKRPWGHRLTEERPWEDTVRRPPSIHPPRREALEETKPVNTLIVGYQPPEPWDDTFLLLKPPSLWYSVLTTWANTACKPHAGDSGMRLTHCVVSPTGLRTLPCVHIYVYLVNEWSLLSVLISIIIYFISQTHG